MKYQDTPENVAALKASQSEFDRWNRYGEFSDEELYGPALPHIDATKHIAPAQVSLLEYRDLSHSLVNNLVSREL